MKHLNKSKIIIVSTPTELVKNRENCVSLPCIRTFGSSQNASILYLYMLFFGQHRRRFLASVVSTPVGVNRRPQAGERGDKVGLARSVHPDPSQALPGRLWGVPGPPPDEGAYRLTSMARATVGQVQTASIFWAAAG